MQRYSFKPEATTEDMRLSVALLIEEDPAGEWVKHEDAAWIIDDLIRQNVALDSELEQATARIADLEARPSLGDDVMRFLADIEWVALGWETAINKEGSTVIDDLKDLDKRYRKLWPVGSTFLYPTGMAEDYSDGDGMEGGDTSELSR